MTLWRAGAIATLFGLAVLVTTNETIIENWVPIDVPHILWQMGVDIFGQMRHQFRQHRPVSVSDWVITSITA